MADQKLKNHYGTDTFQDTANKGKFSNEIIIFSSPEAQSKEICVPVHITDLPAEIFQHILRYLTFDNISKLRLVSRYFNDMCSALLNSEFNHLRVFVQQRFMAIKAQMPRRESSRRKHPLARESDIIETLYMRLTLLNMTFGKHIERKYCCFFAGEIIDEIYKILQYVQNTPSLSRAYKVTDELFDLSTMAMEYFKEHIEPSLPEVTYFASDVFEYPSFSSVKAQHSMVEEAVVVSSDSSYQSSNFPIQGINKKLKMISKKVNRNSKEIANLKRSIKVMSQKVNSIGAIVSQMKKEDNCDTTILPLKINDSHKINKILAQLNTCKEEIEDLTSKLTICSEKDSKLFDLQSLEKRVNRLFGSSYGSSLTDISEKDSKIDWEYLGKRVNRFLSSTSGNSLTDTADISPSCSRWDPLGPITRKFYTCPTFLLAALNNKMKRKLPSSTVTNMIECSESKRKCTIREETDSVNHDE